MADDHVYGGDGGHMTEEGHAGPPGTRTTAQVRLDDYRLFVNAFIRWEMTDESLRTPKPYLYGLFLRIFSHLHDHVVPEAFSEAIRDAAVAALKAVSTTPRITLLKQKLRVTKVTMSSGRKVGAVPFAVLRAAEELDFSQPHVRELCERVGLEVSQDAILRTWHYDAQWLEDNSVDDEDPRVRARTRPGAAPQGEEAPPGAGSSSSSSASAASDSKVERVRPPPRKKIRPSPFAPRSNVNVLASSGAVVSVSQYGGYAEDAASAATNPIPVPYRIYTTPDERLLQLCLPGDIGLYHCAPALNTTHITVQLVYPSDTAGAAIHAGVAPQCAVWSIPVPFKCDPTVPARRWNDTVWVDAKEGVEQAPPSQAHPNPGVRPVSRWAFFEFHHLRLQGHGQQAVLSPAYAAPGAIGAAEDAMHHAAASASAPVAAGPPVAMVQYLPGQFGQYPAAAPVHHPQVASAAQAAQQAAAAAVQQQVPQAVQGQQGWGQPYVGYDQGYPHQ
eukprot:TRINITY_DN1585_c0_g1_i1.p1 TRINITY_DN1585_c0_g1~~TRINITY_DN1585_c0_g1_i1.p1  ORF type:complete len:524 (+),score=58.95 TRINITY_DN1585_c0_g1_i1:71-1573(+)